MERQTRSLLGNPPITLLVESALKVYDWKRGLSYELNNCRIEKVVATM